MNVPVKLGTPSQDDLMVLAAKVTPFWERVGRALGLKDEKLYEIDADVTGVYEKSYAMLRTWLQMKGSAATYGALAVALRHDSVRRNDLASEFCCNVPKGRMRNKVNQDQPLTIN